MVLLEGGLTVLELAMFVLFALNLPWMALGLWNSAIGFVLLRLSRDDLRKIAPLAGSDKPLVTPSGRIAIVVPVHDEDPGKRLPVLDARRWPASTRPDAAEPFDIFLLSDTQDERLASAERTLFAAWKRSDHRPGRLHYRRRLVNVRLQGRQSPRLLRSMGPATTTS